MLIRVGLVDVLSRAITLGPEAASNFSLAGTSMWNTAA